jgi:formylglycine-generating enzyme required for sulfatase activity
MKTTILAVCVIAGHAIAAPAMAGMLKCPPDSVRVGTVCVDIYEASVWRIPATSPTGKSNAGLIKKVQEGAARKADLDAGGALQAQPANNCGGIQLDSAGFPRNGNWTSPFYAVSVSGVFPTACISWFQAAQACALAGKRLLTNQEWQIAAASTVDPGENDGTTNSKCNTLAPAARQAGNAGSTRGGADSCISAWGVQDMVGNLDEWVADWGERGDQPGPFVFPADFGDGSDASKIGRTGSFCFGGANAGARCMADADCPGSQCGSPLGEPAAFQRGGNYQFGTYSGVFALSVGGGSELWTEHPYFGFRCAR